MWYLPISRSEDSRTKNFQLGKFHIDLFTKE